jgi:hypothetical protein
VSSEDYTADVRQALHQVANGHCALAVVWREEFARTEVAGHYPGVMALPVPLLVTDFYLVASRALASDRLAQFTPWWKLIAEWRELPRYLPTGD